MNAARAQRSTPQIDVCEHSKKIHPVRCDEEIRDSGVTWVIATRRLAALVTARGAGLTAIETRSVARALTEGVDLAARVLTAWGGDMVSPDAVSRLSAALPDLQHVVHAQLATLTPPAPAVLFLCQQVRERLAAIAGLVDRVEHDTSAGRRGELVRVAAAVSQWAVEAAGAATAVRDGLHAAAATGRLLAPREDLSRGPDQRYRWMPVPPAGSHDQPTLSAASKAAATLAAGHEQLTEAAGTLAATSRGRAATRQAAATAGDAQCRLRDALSTRTPGELTRLARPARPSTLPGVGAPSFAPTSRGRAFSRD